MYSGKSSFPVIGWAGAGSRNKPGDLLFSECPSYLPASEMICVALLVDIRQSRPLIQWQNLIFTG